MYVCIYSGQIISRKVKAIINPKRGMVEKNILVFFEEDIGEKLFSNDIYHICNFTRNDFRGKKGSKSGI